MIRVTLDIVADLTPAELLGEILIKLCASGDKPLEVVFLKADYKK